MVLRFKQSCVLGLFAFFVFAAATAGVVVQDNGYQNVLVAFSPDIIKDEQPKVLSATQDLMKLASKAVYNATGIHFGEVVLLLPYTWGKLEDMSYIDNIAYSSANEVYYDADIFVEESESTVYGTCPYTLQRGRCGTEGVRITIHKDFLNSNQSPDDERAKIIAREWIRYRYGVFYENGYPNDDRYPLYFRRSGSDNPADVEITGCTNKPVDYTFENSLGEECSLSVDESGRPDEKSATCVFRPQESENNSEVSSSLMYLQDLPNMVYLCGDEDHAHNDAAPNKQNSLCNGRSIWTVMKDHPDFKNRQTTHGTDTPPDPKFKVVVDGNPRIVLAIDLNRNVEDYTTTIVQSATDKFIFDLPNETEFSLLFFDSDVQRVYEKKSFREGRPSVDLVFSRDGTPCPSCAIKEGLKILTDTNSGKKGTIVVFSSTDLDDESPDFLSQVKSSQICVIVVLYESNISSEKFQKLFDTSLCSHVWIMPSADKDNALDVLTQLNEELENVIMSHSYHNPMYTVETASIKDTNPVSFRTDRSIKVFQIRLTSMQSKLGNIFQDSDVELKNSKGEQIEPETLENFKDFRMYTFSTNTWDRWDFKLKFISKKLQEPILLQVVAKGSNSKSLRVRSWTEDTTSQEASETPEQLPVALYVEVTTGINPVLDAKVQAVINRPNEGPVEVELLDNGLGDPDVTNNDGIYSRYFTQFTSEGDYQVTITISDNEGRSQTASPPQSGPPVPCCGSFIPSGAKEVTGPFERVIETNFRARSGPPPLGYKPSRVQDLRLLSWDKMILTFQWTSPGDEMDTGSAKEYIFGLFETKEDAERRFEDQIIDAFIITESFPTPKEYSSKETMKIHLNDSIATDKNYFFAVRSESKKGRQSDTSNIVQIYIPATITSLPPTGETISTRDDGNSDGSNLSSSGGAGKITIIVVSVCVVVIIIFICAYLAFYFIIVRPKRKRDENEGSPKPPRKNSINTDIDNVDGTEAANERQMENNSISPVNSWPSNVLVNHHEKVKEAKRKNERPPVFTLGELESTPDVIKTISNGLLPNPVYGSNAEHLNENPDHGTYASLSLQDNNTVKSSRRVTNV